VTVESCGPNKVVVSIHDTESHSGVEVYIYTFSAALY